MKKHPAQPEQQESGFAEGIERKPRTPKEKQPPDFARGARWGSAREAERKRRFSEGAEQEPETSEKNVERRFSEGVDRSPTSD
jgi:hypothetical protein